MMQMLVQWVLFLCAMGFLLWLHERDKNKALTALREEHATALEDQQHEAAETYGKIGQDLMEVFGPAVEQAVRKNIEADVRRELAQRAAEHDAFVHRVNLILAMTAASRSMRRARVC